MIRILFVVRIKVIVDGLKVGVIVMIRVKLDVGI